MERDDNSEVMKQSPSWFLVVPVAYQCSSEDHDRKVGTQKDDEILCFRDETWNIRILMR